MLRPSHSHTGCIFSLRAALNVLIVRLLGASQEENTACTQLRCPFQNIKGEWSYGA
jgi:hypothetical protein